MGKQREGCLLNVGDFPLLSSSGISLCFNQCLREDGEVSARACLGLLEIAVYLRPKILHLWRTLKVCNLTRFQNKSLYFP